MPTPDDGAVLPAALEAPAAREELVAMIARAHLGSAYGDSAVAGRTLAAQSKLPKVIAENLGAGFGQWDFFPEAAEIVDFALAYAPPSIEEDMWTLARSWASDEASVRPTLMALVGREILHHELRRIDVPKLRELLDERQPARALELRKSLGLAVPTAAPAKPASKRKAAATPGMPARTATPATPGMPARAATPAAIPTRMPKPKFVAPPKREPAPPARRFHHPKFGTGALEAQDGVGSDAKLTIKFEAGSKTLLARYVTEVEAGSA